MGVIVKDAGTFADDGTLIKQSLTPLADVSNRPQVTGSRSGGAALTSLLAALSRLGVITDNTTA